MFEIAPTKVKDLELLAELPVIHIGPLLKSDKLPPEWHAQEKKKKKKKTEQVRRMWEFIFFFESNNLILKPFLIQHAWV